MANKPKKQSENANDWQQSDEEDNWDDWGDDDDKFVELSAAEEPEKPVSSESSNKSNNNASTTQSAPAAEDQQMTASKATTPSSGSSSWGLWGGKLTSVLTTATEGLGNITNQVNQGLNQIIGVPDPEELARSNVAEKAKEQAAAPAETEAVSPTRDSENGDPGAPGFGLGFVTTLGSKVLNTGLDTLEGIGKKTMNILQENDPKLINKRKLLGLDANKPNLSAILLEAKKDADQMENSLRQLELEKQKAQLRFEILFENYCGLVHYEALEILSKESRLKLDTLLEAVSGNALSELQETINEVKELLDLEDLECESEGDYAAEGLGERLLSTIADTEVGIQFDDIANHWSQSLGWLDSEESKTADLEETYAKSIHALSEACALEMCKLHKIAELLLVKSHHSTANEVDGIANLCKQFNAHLQGLTHRYAAILSTKSTSDEELAKTRDTNMLFTEMLAAVKFIEQAYKLFTPILQMGAV
ncbi:protein FAM114A2 [Scaptodrosophila lebanonensis]|uniref:Protein FAM114A2 n=1 Tax=Drosophila lebanonensis TaxID=7225 RepID=A0A6J2TDM9_DROLE|nr:protein FAM114A2 [Scaptodrosophila lebanonensis]